MKSSLIFSKNLSRNTFKNLMWLDHLRVWMKMWDSCVLIPLFYFWIVKLLFLPLTNWLYVYASYKMCGSVKNTTRTGFKARSTNQHYRKPYSFSLGHTTWFAQCLRVSSGDACFSCPLFLQICFQRNFQLFE